MSRNMFGSVVVAAILATVVTFSIYQLFLPRANEHGGAMYCIDSPNVVTCNEGWVSEDRNGDTEPPEEFEAKVKMLGGSSSRTGEHYRCEVEFTQIERKGGFLLLLAPKEGSEFPLRLDFWPDEHPELLPEFVKWCGPVPSAG